MRILFRLVVWGLGAYGAKTLYEKNLGSVDRVRQTGRAAVERVGRASERVKGRARGAADDLTVHAGAASEELGDTAPDFFDLSQSALSDDVQLQPHDA